MVHLLLVDISKYLLHYIDTHRHMNSISTYIANDRVGKDVHCTYGSYTQHVCISSCWCLHTNNSLFFHFRIFWQLKSVSQRTCCFRITHILVNCGFYVPNTILSKLMYFGSSLRMFVTLFISTINKYHCHSSYKWI